ncbi:MAG: hypothetical protein Q8N96_03000 [Methylovulum sp.]|nr:hypothetical protein [Methylovulum sp.]
MQHIETVADVNQNGFVTIALPAHIRPGKHHILLVIDEALSEDNIESVDHAAQLMKMAGRISAFKTIDNPVLWQQQQRDEWQRDGDK